MYFLTTGKASVNYLSKKSGSYQQAAHTSRHIYLFRGYFPLLCSSDWRSFGTGCHVQREVFLQQLIHRDNWTLITSIWLFFFRFWRKSFGKLLNPSFNRVQHLLKFITNWIKLKFNYCKPKMFIKGCIFKGLNGITLVAWCFCQAGIFVKRVWLPSTPCNILNGV